MAKTIALEFTDGQWELIKAHYDTFNEYGELVDCTEETFASTIKNVISFAVTNTMANKAKEANQNAFNV